MRNKFDEQLHVLNQEMTSMGSMIEEAITKAVHALVNQDKELAKEIMDGDAEINNQQKTIENICFQLLLQQQPVARDLRTVSAALKMVTDMERIGDHAADISEMAILMSGHNYVMDFKHINRMATETMAMLIEAVEAYVEKDADKAKEVILHDDIVDDIFIVVKGDLIKMIGQHPEYAEQAADLLMVAKYLERVGDHAVNIGEWVIYSLDDKK